MRRFLILLASFVLLPLPSLADEVVLPELFSVVDNADQASINIRSEPNEAATILGTLTPKGNTFEVVAFDSSGEWAQINFGETAGWIERRFISPNETSWKNGELPVNLSCYGTEPFWSLQQEGGNLIISEPGATDRSLALIATMDRGYEADRLRSVIAKDDAGQLTAVIQPNICSDGMSDRSFALGATLIFNNKEQAPRLLTGCCSIKP